MYQFRSFRNPNPPHLAAIWRTQPPQRGLVQPMSAALLEQCVLGKQNFDPNGLIVATESEVPVAFAHAAFGPNDSGSALDTHLGTTHVVLVHPDHDEQVLGGELLSKCESYLRSCGAQVLYGGGIRPLCGFYLGLYGGSELPGILDSDLRQRAIFSHAGYRAIDRVIVLNCDLSIFRPPISRKYRDCSRKCRVDVTIDPSATSWWDACTTGRCDRLAYSLVRRDGRQPIGQATLWDMEPISTAWGVRTVGLDSLEINADCRRRGMATCLMCNVLNDLRQQGVAVVETQTMQHNEPALALYCKLGFVEIDRGSVFRKDATPIAAP